MTNFGYACINMTLSKEDVTTNRSMIRKTFDKKGLPYASELALKNCEDLIKILRWNVENKIFFFRLSSNLFPWSSEYNLTDLRDFEKISSSLRAAGSFAKNNGIRITSHPGPFNKLCSSDDGVVKNTIKDLETHGEVFDLIGLEKSPYAKINIHVGATYGNKDATIKQFCKNFEKLTDSVKLRLTIENDDKESMFSTKELCEGLHKYIGVSIVHDQHHHGFCDGGISQEDAMNMAFLTWSPKIKPVIHYSESKQIEYADTRIKPQAHSDFIKNKINLYNLDVDVMIEAKMKELSLKKYLSEHEEKYAGIIRL
jgi:UV DNA damage endonuclease